MIRNLSFYDFQFEDEIAIAAPAESGWAFFEDMERNYTLWHPDHRLFEWRKGKGLAVGNVYHFEEMMAGKLLRKTTRITEVVPNRYFAFAMTNPVFRFFLPHLSFGFAPSEEGFVFRAELRLHGIGPIGRRLNQREFDAVEVHMAEEGRNLKALLEINDRAQSRMS